ncbi:hypothetical protein AXK12_05705 [Cephaloticoccus capnophilus]|uniref:Uncharacterized protein n=1 Tax=Cephaloticoccus capnophilus TaxID=1548208 RepID=A0A139SKX4_9BACT|nr:hypothetical protein AXK12_05705 [Cephaloticoccus capnophilus]
MVGESGVAKVGFGEAAFLNHRAHRTAEDGDALAQERGIWGAGLSFGGRLHAASDRPGEGG